MQKEYALGGWSSFFRFVFNDTRIAPFWFIVRIYVGWEWLTAGWEKVQNPAWFGSGAGAALRGFVQGAVGKSVCAPTATSCHPDVQMWYASFLQSAVLPHPIIWSNLVASGEVLVGIALILGFLTGLSAFWGVFMNLNYLLAGAVSINPILYTLGIGLICAWRVSGYIGLDHFVLPFLDQHFRAAQAASHQDTLSS